MAVQVRDQKFRFRLKEPWTAFLPSHEVGGHFVVPRSLCLIKDDNSINWRSFVPQPGISKVMDILNERLHFLLDVRLPLGCSFVAKTFDGIATEGLTKHRNQRVVS